MKEKLEITELILKILKDILSFLFLAALIIWIYHHYNVKLDKFNLFGIEGVITNKVSATVIANQNDDKKGDVDTAATGMQADAAFAITTEEPGWLYIGTFKDGKFIDSIYFSFKENKIPQINSFAFAKVDMNKRASKPYLNENNQWWKGKVIGLVTAGTKVKFIEVAQDIPAKGGGIRIWAKAIPIQ